MKADATDSDDATAIDYKDVVKTYKAICQHPAPADSSAMAVTA